jgi:hypothetical protein
MWPLCRRKGEIASPSSADRAPKNPAGPGGGAAGGFFGRTGTQRRRFLIVFKDFFYIFLTASYGFFTAFGV